WLKPYLLAFMVALWVPMCDVAGFAQGQDSGVDDLQPQKSRRIALVIGIESYPYLPDALRAVPNAINDANKISEVLKNEVDFDDVTQLTNNPTHAQIVRALADVSKRVQAINGPFTILFYFAGHGFQVGGVNFLMASDVSLDGTERQLSIQLADILGL